MHRQTILIADDQKHMLMLLQASLASLDCRVLTASSGEEALAQAAGAPIDLLLIDFEMSGLTGVETVRQLKVNPRYANLPTVLITGRGQKRIRAEAALAGVTLVMTKPFSPTELLEITRQLLLRAGQPPQPEAV